MGNCHKYLFVVSVSCPRIIVILPSFTELWIAKIGRLSTICWNFHPRKDSRHAIYKWTYRSTTCACSTFFFFESNSCCLFSRSSDSPCFYNKNCYLRSLICVQRPPGLYDCNFMHGWFCTEKSLWWATTCWTWPVTARLYTHTECTCTLL